MKRIIVILLSIIAIGTLAVAGKASEPLKIAIISRTVFYVPLWIAQKQGFFKDAGIDSSIQIYDNAEQINTDLRLGTAQISISTPEGVIMDAYKGGQLRIIAGNAERLPHFIIASPKIKNVSQFRGARIGVLSLTDGTSYLAREVAKSAGLTPNDYEIMQVGGAPTRAKLLREGKIDVGLQPFPLSYEAEEQGFNNLGPVSKYVPDYLFTTVNADDVWAGAHEQVVATFLRALARGQRYMEAHPDEAVDVAAAELNTSKALAERALQDTKRLRILSADLSISRPALTAVIEGLISTEQLPKGTTVNFSKVVDERYLNKSR